MLDAKTYKADYLSPNMERLLGLTRESVRKNINTLALLQDVYKRQVAMTANAFSEDRQAALDAGMNDHIAKPIDMNILVSTLRKYL